MFKYFHQIWQSNTLRRKIVFTLFVLLVFRLAGHFTVPGVNVQVLQTIFQQNSLLGIFSALTGGSMENFSIVLMGLSPYINASIIVQLLTVVIPQLEALSKEGASGQKKLNQYTRFLTVPLGFLQSYGMIILLNRSANGQLIPDIDQTSLLLGIMVTVTAGTIFLMWLGELITERGIGNGVSLLIFAGIVAEMPTHFGRMLGVARAGDTTQLTHFILFALVAVLLLILVVIITEAQRNIPITYSTRATGARGEKSFLPIRLNQAGMIPIIFAISIITFPSVIAQFFKGSASAKLQTIADFILKHFNTSNPSYVYMILYFILIIAFSYFYVSVTFNTEQISENIQKRGGFIPGIRPGRSTAEFLAHVSNHLNLFGGIFLAIVAIVPMLFTKYTSLAAGDLIISGSGMIIIVGVVLDLMRQINAQLMMHDYDKLY